MTISPGAPGVADARGAGSPRPAPQEPGLPRPLNILFVMQYPGYLRYYDSTIQLLAERGHTIYLAYDLPNRQSEGAEALSPCGERVVLVGITPRREDLWPPVANAIRRAADYSRYLHPRFAQAHYLRRRMENKLSWVFRWMTWISTLEPRLLDVVTRALLTLERAIPSSRAIEGFLRELQPDVAVVTPFVTTAYRQTDLVKAASTLGVPTVVGVASWDHLTTKGLIRLEPNRVIVWNESQREEARTLHGVSPEKVVVSGAQPFDRWFDRAPSTTRQEFCQKVGLPTHKPFVLFVGSTASISAPDAEQRFVRRWIGALRASPDAELRELAVLVRPHPYNPGNWPEADLSELGDVAIWPRDGANPVNRHDRADYFDSLAHSVAVVGINTSAMIEAAIVGRPVFTILAPEFADTQSGTIHFRYLLPEHGGFVRVASDLQEHALQLADALRHPDAVRHDIEQFLRSFVRPLGLETPSTPLVVEAIEQVAAAGAAPQVGMSPFLYPIQALLWLLARAIHFFSREPGGQTLRRYLRSADRKVRQLTARAAKAGRKVRQLAARAAKWGRRASKRAASLYSRLQKRARLWLWRGEKRVALARDIVRRRISRGRRAVGDDRRARAADRPAPNGRTAPPRRKSPRSRDQQDGGSSADLTADEPVGSER